MDGMDTLHALATPAQCHRSLDPVPRLCVVSLSLSVLSLCSLSLSLSCFHLSLFCFYLSLCLSVSCLCLCLSLSPLSLCLSPGCWGPSASPWLAPSLTPSPDLAWPLLALSGAVLYLGRLLLVDSAPRWRPPEPLIREASDPKFVILSGWQGTSLTGKHRGPRALRGRRLARTGLERQRGG
jgi:hypothetical protein